MISSCSFQCLFLNFLCLRTLVIKVCQRVLWVKSLGSWVSPISCRLLQSMQHFRQAQFMGCSDWSQARLFGNSWVRDILCVLCLSAQWYLKKLLLTDKRSHSNGSRNEEGREGREKSWPTAFCSVISKLYGSGLVSITLSWTSFKLCKCLCWATHNRTGA